MDGCRDNGVSRTHQQVSANKNRSWRRDSYKVGEGFYNTPNNHNPGAKECPPRLVQNTVQKRTSMTVWCLLWYMASWVTRSCN